MLAGMERPGATPRVLLSALLLTSAIPLRADPERAVGVPVPKSDPRKDPKAAADPIKDACDGEAVSVRIDDPAGLPDGVSGPPAPKPDRAKEAQNTANRLGAGVEAEFDENGQTLSWKRGRSTKADCRQRLQRIRRDYGSRVSFEPTTAERVEEVRKRRDALIPEAMRRSAGTANLGGFFDGSALLAGKLTGKDVPDVSVVRPIGWTAPAGDPAAQARFASSQPDRQLPVQYQRPLSSVVPTFARTETPTLWQRATSAWGTATDYMSGVGTSISQGISDAGSYVSGVARSVKNRFFTGIEMIQGYGYRMIRAFRGSNWGTKPLVDGLRAIAAYMRGGGKAQTDLAIGDISSANGGRLGGHLSHQVGRDVDIGFYMTDARTGQPVEGEFVRFAPGRGGLLGNLNGRTVRFDADRNWMLVQAILHNPDPNFKPTNIFIDNNLKRAILQAGGSSPEVPRAAQLMSYWPGHDNHLHLRVQ